MDQEFAPSTLPLKLTAVFFSLFGVILCFTSGLSGLIAIVAVGMVVALYQFSTFIARYQKFVLAKNSLLIKTWTGKTETEIRYSEISKVYFRTGTAEHEPWNRNYSQEAEEVSLWMKSGRTVHLNVTPIDDSKVFSTLLKQRVEG